MKILVIGGTIFVGRHFVECALEAGHDVTIFHRGNHANPFKQAREILGNRDRDLGMAANEDWDVVIDTCAYIPEHVEAVGQALGSRMKRYVLISTISVYSDHSKPNISEDATLGQLENISERSITNTTYGPLKVLCEARARDIFGEASTLIVRPGLIVGPFDPTGRYTYWIERIAAGGKVFVPGEADSPSQFIDARDLASFILLAILDGRIGVVHATGPKHPLTMREFLEQSREAIGSDAEFIWGSEKFLSRFEKLAASIPFWAPADHANLFRVDISKALSWGLVHRPIGQTARDTLAWAQANDSKTSNYLNREQERMLIEEIEKENTDA